jgi:hypothetical protein
MAAIDQQEGPPPVPDYEPPAPAEDPVPPAPAELDDEPAVEPEPEPTDADLLVPKIDPVERILTDERGNQMVFVQKTLGYFPKIELFGLLARAMDVIMASENGLKLDELLGLAQPQNLIEQVTRQLPGADDVPDEADANEIDALKLMHAFSRLVAVSPEMLQELYCIALQAKPGHRKWLMEWAFPNLDDELGEDIMETFIDQNMAAVEDFFVQYLRRLAKRAAQAHRRHKASATARSKR